MSASGDYGILNERPVNAIYTILLWPNSRRYWLSKLARKQKHAIVLIYTIEYACGNSVNLRGDGMGMPESLLMLMMIKHALNQ